MPLLLENHLLAYIQRQKTADAVSRHFSLALGERDNLADEGVFPHVFLDSQNRVNTPSGPVRSLTK